MALRRKTAGLPDPGEVNDLVHQFWAKGPGGNGQLAAVCDASRRAGLTAPQLKMIRASVPEGEGPTGRRCARVREVLQGLAEEVA